MTGARPFVPTWELLASLALHAAAVGVLLVAERCTRPAPPPFRPDEVALVTAVALPRQQGRMPDKPMRTPDPPQGAPDASAPPPPPTASDMALHRPDAPRRAGDRTRDADRRRLLDEMRRRALVEELRDPAAPLGDRDRARTSPDGVDPSQAVLGAGTGGIDDPELARYVAAAREAIVPNWIPLPATVRAHPDYEVVVRVPVAADGRLGGPEVVRSSGDPSFDRSALLAVIKTGRLPPPPERWRESAARGVLVVLRAADKQ